MNDIVRNISGWHKLRKPTFAPNFGVIITQMRKIYFFQSLACASDKVMLQILQNFHIEASQYETSVRIQKTTLEMAVRYLIVNSRVPVKDGYRAQQLRVFGI